MIMPGLVVTAEEIVGEEPAGEAVKVIGLVVVGEAEAG